MRGLVPPMRAVVFALGLLAAACSQPTYQLPPGPEGGTGTGGDAGASEAAATDAAPEGAPDAGSGDATDGSPADAPVEASDAGGD